MLPMLFLFSNPGVFLPFFLVLMLFFSSSLSPHPYQVYYEPMIFWVASGADFRRLLKKWAHFIRLLEKDGVEVSKIFDKCDPDEKGVVSIADFERVIRKLGVPFTTGELR